MANIEQSKITSNNETFTKGTYNSIDIIIRDKDGYINATALCNQFGRRFAKLQDNKTTWKLYYNTAEKHIRAYLPNSGGIIYELKKGYNRELYGQYVHPKLVNYIAMWASAEYAFVVSEIMDTVNEYTQAMNKSLIEAKDDIIEHLNEMIEEQKQTINELQTRAVPESVKDKHIKLLDEGKKFKISADNKREFKNVICKFHCPASMNMKQIFKQADNKKSPKALSSKPYYVFDKEALEEIKQIIINNGGVEHE